MTNSTRPLSFQQWLAQHQHEASAIGDLARDALADRSWPNGAEYLDRYEEHLKSMHASQGALDTLQEAWKRYEIDRGETDDTRRAQIRLESIQALSSRFLVCGWNTHGGEHCGEPATVLYPCTVYDPEDLAVGACTTRAADLAFCPDHDPHRVRGDRY